MFPIVAQIDAPAVLHKVILFNIAQKVTNVLGYFCKQICYQELSKIAQSGHTDGDTKRDDTTYCNLVDLLLK